MQIKDVEKLTGLTAKSIRFYEAKGLIDVKRNEENSYRSYSENDVERLKLIKLFRYLEFSVEEIKSLLDKDEEQIKEKGQKFLKGRKAIVRESRICVWHWRRIMSIILK